jgi:hypothetical protein
VKDRAVFESLMTYAKNGNLAYFVMMTARPQAVGYGPTDSPAGLAAWPSAHPGFAQWTYGADPARQDHRRPVGRAQYLRASRKRTALCDGRTSVFRRNCIAAKVSGFSLRDLRAKGAPDEYRAGRPIRELQNRHGHRCARRKSI